MGPEERGDEAGPAERSGLDAIPRPERDRLTGAALAALAHADRMPAELPVGEALLLALAADREGVAGRIFRGIGFDPLGRKRVGHKRANLLARSGGDLATLVGRAGALADPAGTREIGTAHLLATVLDTATFDVLCAGLVSGTVQGRITRLAYAAIMAGEQDGTEGDGDPDGGQRVRHPRPSLGPPGQIHLAEPEPDWGDE